ncbi:T9SS type A sorting domain-containing protein [Labilibaculum sp.]|uniref:type IX secretion system anionic LPS delivery protein PorZ n=1 Tax=Labilibaculum sp. TaxID=2060723 RepID=UPI0035699BF6
MKLVVGWILTFLLTVSSLNGRGQIKIGDWREHLPYLKAEKLLVGNEKLYCLTVSGLFSYSLSDNEIVAYSKTAGLSESEISAIGWADGSEILLIGYSSGNIDLISNGAISNIPDVKNYSLLDEKAILCLATEGDFAYLGTEFGIVAINLEKEEVADTYYIGEGGAKLSVNDLIISNNIIWAATDEGLFHASLTASNLADFNSWEQEVEIPSYQRECESIEAIGDDLFLSRFLSDDASELYRLVDGNWTNFSGSFSRIFSLRNVDDQLWVIQADEVLIFNTNGIQSSQIQVSEVSTMRDALKIEGRIFMADYQQSLLELEGSTGEQIKPDGPLSENVSSLYSVEDQTWLVPGGITSTYAGLGEEAALSVFQDQKWTNYTSENTDAFAGKYDLTTVVGDKSDASRIYAASWGDGLFVFDHGEYQANWNTVNSPLGSKGISGMDSDEDGNLWILDAASTEAIKLYSEDGEWFSLSYSTLANRSDMKKIQCLSNGDKWVLNGVGQALFAFNENESFSDQDDDVLAAFYVRDEDNSIISSNVYDFIEDDNGDVWVGTSSGVAVYANPGYIFRSGSFYAYQPIITIDGSTQYLLTTETVNCIALNGANQKWLGTAGSGAYLVSEDGDEQLTHFTSENSSLPSNTIEKISVNPGTGEVFFVTDLGMVSYKGEVTSGSESYSDLYVYPNPVRETYHGDVVVSGLIAESTVKITDISGNLVMEGKSDGGQFIWDGKNFNGSRVHTGVYLIFCSNSDASKSKVIKLLFIH